MENSLRLAIVKYSYSPDFAISSHLPIAAENKVAWTTIGHPNMLFVMEHSKFGLLHSPTSSLCLKVSRDSEVLELVQLQRLCEAALTAPWNLKPIQAVVSSPRLAITYHVTDSSARRLQFRFANESDFASALGVLEGLRCPITAATNRPRTAQRLANTPVPHSNHRDGERPHTSGSTEAFVPHRLTTPIAEQDVLVQSDSSTAPCANYSSRYDVLERHASSQSQSRPATAPLTQDEPANQNFSQPLHERFKGRDCQNQPFNNPASNAVASPHPRASLPPFPTPTFTRALSSANVPGSFNLRGPRTFDKATGPKVLSRAHSISTPPLDASFSQPSRSSSPTTFPACQDDDPLTRLREYVAKPNSERQIIIDDMLCHYINNDDFLKLCEDVENSWRRIGIDVRQ